MSAPFQIKGTTAVRKDPACGTCRKKCRKCDRTRPVCKRCIQKGLHCEGYPPRFQFNDAASSAVESHDVGLSLGPASPPATPTSPPTAKRNLKTASKSSSSTMHSDPSTNAATTTHETPIPPLRPAPQPTPAQRFSSAESQDDDSKLTELLATNDRLLTYFDNSVIPTLAISLPGIIDNPVRRHVLPLAQVHLGVCHALLGMSAIHAHYSVSSREKEDEQSALQHRVAALNSLGALLLKEEVVGLNSVEEEFVLAMVFLLVFSDICESGFSAQGAHLTGVAFLCGRIASPGCGSQKSDSVMFFLSTLAWLDALRGFSGAEKLSYSPGFRACVLENSPMTLHSMVGCPPEIFESICSVLSAAKDHKADKLPLAKFQTVLDDTEASLRAWDPETAVYPTDHTEWKQLGIAYRHACLLRTIRWPDTFAIPCESEGVRISVNAILDVCAEISPSSPFYKRLLFPLFMAGADTSSPHQMRYVEMCIGEIKRKTGFHHGALSDILSRVWEERRNPTKGWPNVPWMEWTCTSLLGPQHAYLFF